jgi:hypothetical protein
MRSQETALSSHIICSKATGNSEMYVDLNMTHTHTHTHALQIRKKTREGSRKL